MDQENLLYKKEREQMVKAQIESRGIQSPAVLKAMREVPRHAFVPSHLRSCAYDDSPLPIGYEQTISQPYIVGFMSQALQAKSTDRILEIGTGCGYQSAILSRICKKVFTIEIIEPLAKQAKELFKELNYDNIEARLADGYQGWPEAAPFDAIILTAAPLTLPSPLTEQVKIGGTILLPVGNPTDQRLLRITRTKEGLHEQELLAVRFVPMTGQASLTL